MSDILEDLSHAALVSAIENNLFAFSSLFGRWDRSETREDSEIFWSVTDIPSPLFNSVLHARLEPDRIDPTIEEIKSLCRARNVPILWWTGPATRPADLPSYLQAHGFTYDGNARGMAVDLQTLKEFPPTPPLLSITPVCDHKTLRQFCETGTMGFGMPEFVSTAFMDFLTSIGVAYPFLRNYIGLQDRIPVAISSLFLGAGVAGIYNVATLPQARRQGIGAAMTLEPLKQAREMGYRVGILHASRMGAPVYAQLGFQEYCEIGQYIWPGAPAEA